MFGLNKESVYVWFVFLAERVLDSVGHSRPWQLNRNTYDAKLAKKEVWNAKPGSQCQVHEFPFLQMSPESKRKCGDALEAHETELALATIAEWPRARPKRFPLHCGGMWGKH